MNLQEFRQKYPQYNDVNDIDLSRRFHAKFYSDMPFAELAGKIGLDTGGVDPNIFDTKDTGIIDLPLDPYKIERFFEPQKPAVPMGTREQIPSVGGFVTPRTLGGRIAAKGPQIIGGTIGGAIGAAIPSIGEEPALVGGGSALGQYVLAPLTSAIFGITGRAMILSPNDPDFGRKLLYAALEEGLGEFGGRAAAGAIGRVFLRPFRGAVIPEAELADIALRQAGKRAIARPRTQLGRIPYAAKRVGLGIERAAYRTGQVIRGEPGAAARIGRRYGAHLLPGQITESFGDTLQAVAEGSFFYGGAVRRFETQTQKAALGNLQNALVRNVKRELIGSVGTKRATAILADLSNANAKAISAIEHGLYKTIDELADQAVDITPLKELAQSFTGKGLKPGARQAMLRQVAKKPIQQTFEELKNIRSDAWQYWEKFNRAGEKNNARIARLIATKTDELMEQAAMQGSQRLKAAWRTADKFHRGKLRWEWLTDTLAKYGKAEDVATSKGFVNYIAKMSKSIEGKPSELAKMGFTKTEIDQIVDYSRAARWAMEKAVGGGRMLVQLTQASAIIQLAGIPVAAFGIAEERKGITGGGIAMIIGPSLLARMIISPTGAKLLSTGLRAPPGSRSVGTLGLRLLREAAYHEAERKYDGETTQLWIRYVSPPLKPSDIKAPTIVDPADMPLR